MFLSKTMIGIYKSSHLSLFKHKALNSTFINQMCMKPYNNSSVYKNMGQRPSCIDSLGDSTGLLKGLESGFY